MLPNIAGMESGVVNAEIKSVKREISIRWAFYLPFFGGVLAASLLDVEKEVGSVYLVWGSLLSILYISLTLHPRLSKTWGARFEVFGIVLVAWGAFLVSGLPSGAWAAVTTGGACLLMAFLHLILAQDAGQQSPREDQ